MGMDIKNLLMAVPLRDNISMGNHKELASINGQMGNSMKENGSMDSRKAMECGKELKVMNM